MISIYTSPMRHTLDNPGRASKVSGRHSLGEGGPAVGSLLLLRRATVLHRSAHTGRDAIKRLGSLRTNTFRQGTPRQKRCQREAAARCFVKGACSVANLSLGPACVCLRVSNPICRRKHHSTAGRNLSSAENVPGNKGSEMGSVQPEERSPGAMRTAKRR
ncbi:uncharacterized protein CIMG_12780 [Coccidioides immitis RS]|uniref:Uncharacterized protein n=1 Tax=Coccidioides immitis (strain RS) TaxID=246410 RepID=A0A0D8JT80_COCIM|nr:uncharacterized protein CIMG_12780 [Coccidioides immitis RS]KJF60151.1 hypothetical protein CIMG_12780 [Coccidioides immitis RS]